MNSGFVVVVGRTNVGKSTLVNGLVGEKVAIVTPKPQTTRNVIRGIYTEARGQIVFLDTPGIHKPMTRMNEAMVHQALQALGGVEAVIWMIHAAQPWHREEETIAQCLGEARKPLVIALNQVDLLKDKTLLLPLMAKLSERFPGVAIYPLSATRPGDYGKLLEILFPLLPEGEPLFPADTYTDQMERQLAAELVREQIFLQLRQEVPHCAGVLVESFEEALGEEEQVRIACAILVERDSQKPILIGKGGETLKRIGTAARLEINRVLGCRVDLRLWVKVRPDWRENATILRQMGLA